MTSHQSIGQRRHSTNLLPDLYTEHAHQPAHQQNARQNRSELLFSSRRQVSNFSKHHAMDGFKKKQVSKRIMKKDRIT